MTELRDRVVERLTTAQNASSAAPLRGPDAVSDALALLREAAPAPGETVDLAAVAAVCWTFWLRHQGPEDPDAQRNMTIAFSAFGFLCPRVPADAQLPQPLRNAFDPADPAHDARFAYLVSSAYGDAAGNAPDLTAAERLTALDRALAWSDTARQQLPEDHEGFAELAFHGLGLNVLRFQLAADPHALATAARHAAAVCERLPSPGPAAAEAGRIALGTVLDAARLLGEPPLAEVERLVAAAPDGALTPEAAEGLRLLRELYAVPTTWPGERDLRIGASITEAGAREHDAARVACGVRRLRTALAHTPADHPARPVVTATLGQALHAFAGERGDLSAAREALDLLATASATTPLPDAESELLAELRQLMAVMDGDDPLRFHNARPLLGRVLERVREHGGPAPDIDLEVLDIAIALPSGPVSDERIARYRTAVAALPADAPHRYAYAAVLAALTGARGQALRETEPERAAQLAAEAAALTDEVAAAAPADFLPLGLLRRGIFDAALPVAVSTVPIGVPEDDAANGELAKLVSLVSRMADIRLDGREHLDSDIAVMRDMLADIGEDDSLGASLGGVLGMALYAHASAQGDPGPVDEAVPLLRHARAHGSEHPEGFDQILASALTMSSIGRFDAEAAREASALLASAAAQGGATDADLALLSARTQFFNAVENYLFGHEPGQLVRARELAGRLKELVAEATPHPGLDVLGDALLNLVDSIGPGGGPKPDLTDEDIDRFRETFAACPPGHPMRLFTASTLVRALAQRAVAVRAADQEHSARLVAEAEEVLGAVAAQAPDGWADMTRTFIGVVGTGSLPALSPSDQPPETPAPANAVQAMLASLGRRLSGIDDPAAGRDRGIPVWFRAHGEIGAAAGALRRGKGIDVALDHLDAAVEAMAAVTDRGSDQRSAEHGLTTFEGDIRSVIELVLLEAFGHEAAASVHRLGENIKSALAEGRLPEDLPQLGELFRVVAGPEVDRATEVLVRGRGLLLSRRIESRADLSELRSGHPELADEFERLTDQLAAETDAPEPAPAGHAEWSRLAKLRASRELDELVERIRAQPGLDGFLRPLSAEQLRSLATDGPIVVLNHARRYCHALVVTAGDITALRLEAESDEITDAARRLRGAVDATNAHGPARPSPAELIAAGATVREVLAWTWHKVVGPVLDLVGSRQRVADGGRWPRIWWVPTGSFSALPLHAAQCTLAECELGDCGAALDAVVSSYVPGFQTLAYARAQAAHRDAADNTGALLVAAPEDELPGVAAAAEYAAGLLGAGAPLVGTAATRAAVLAALGGTPWAHFGCHAATDPLEPSGALLHLPSGEPLSVLEICRARPGSARLAFLAACGTARSSERLSDEAIHITSAFLLAGFPAAVGTLWEIDSTHADQVTRAFYRRMTGDDASSPAHALHHTVRELRRRIADRPHIWAAYVHAGT
ncbi:CHAT domain-containing protein [Streptantibioticus rubrisoli]|uniref:CHAT domain-containing protein n=1 Tax=Streptantibioticus rubrisoli TaxID=1387313 RepID=A0ABT1PD09_9ACTN|nr:CHAT domain-containing protein [Streptantibioticus rubrisoli]MCQ4043235.1 CHAT domain-containing protein [Streptantibioticus rubrisoli]